MNQAATTPAGATAAPPAIHVIVSLTSPQRTNKSFNARRWCGSRTYEYYLPAYTLGLDTPDGSSPEDQARLALLRDVLQTYCGYKPFQNFAGNRSQYVGQRAKGESEDLQLDHS
jgi:tRNA U38,U39,U40 pseudouridine synthase TruA